MLSQEKLLDILKPLLEERGKKYKKNKKVLAKKAKIGEQIKTITGDGLETVNKADQGDFIIQNMTQAGEKYLISEKSFRERYHFLRKARSGYSEYAAQGEICALVLDDRLLDALKQPNCFHFLAAWGEPMVAKEGDFLVCPPDLSEVYRIARKEFYETYVPS
jgi:hypothetical protein